MRNKLNLDWELIVIVELDLLAILYENLSILTLFKINLYHVLFIFFCDNNDKDFCKSCILLLTLFKINLYYVLFIPFLWQNWLKDVCKSGILLRNTT